MTPKRKKSRPTPNDPPVAAEAPVEPPVAAPRRRIPASPEERESVFARLPWLFAMQGLVLVVLLYPMRVEANRLASWVSRWKATPDSFVSRFMLEQVESWISFYHSPLVLKGTFAAISAVMLAAAIYLRNVLTVPAAGLAGGATPARPLGERFAFASIPAFALWSALSIAWSPTPGFSLQAGLWMGIFATFAFLLFRRGISGDEVRQLATLLILLGAVVFALSLGQGFEFTRRFVVRAFLAFDDRRNALGSLMGHNTAVGSLALLSGFPALALAFATRSRVVRVLLAIWLALAFMTVVAVQSRSAWLLGATMGPIFLRILLRRFFPAGSGRPTRLVGWLAAVAVLAVGTQLVDRPWNPFFIQGNPLVRRLADFSPDVLLKGTRARMIFCSGSLLAEAPILGHGLHSFQYVFPKAQGDYFSRNPDTFLGTTLKRSHMAHNEYLQAWIESGLPGLALMLLVLAEIFFRGRRVGASLDDDGDRALHLAFGFSTAFLCFHALADFHFHVPQVVWPWILCAAAFAAPRREPEDRVSFAAAEERGRAGDSAPVEATTLRGGHVARLVLAWAGVLAAPFFAYPFARAYRADIDASYGQAYLTAVRDHGEGASPAEADRFLLLAIRELTRARLFEPWNGQPWYFLAETRYHRGKLLARLEASQPESVRSLAPARAEFETALEQLDRSETALRYHNTYWMRALCYQELLRLTPPDRRAPLEEGYKRSLELALQYAPSFATPAYYLERWHAARGGAPELLVSLRRRIKESDPFFFHRVYEIPANRAFAGRDFPRAIESVDLLLGADPDDAENVTYAMNVYMEAGDAERARAAIERLKSFRVAEGEFHPFWLSWGALYEAILNRDWAAVAASLSNYGGELPEARATLLAIESHVREKASLPDLPSRFERPRDLDADAWARLVAERRAYVAHRLFHDPEAAATAYAARAAMPGPPPPIEFWLDYAWFARETGDREALQRAVREASLIDPNHGTLPRFTAPAPPPAA